MAVNLNHICFGCLSIIFQFLLGYKDHLFLSICPMFSCPPFLKMEYHRHKAPGVMARDDWVNQMPAESAAGPGSEAPRVPSMSI